MTEALYSRSELGPPIAERAPWAAQQGPATRRLLHVFPSFNIGGAQVRFAAIANALGPRFSHTVLALAGGYEAADLPGLRGHIRYVAPPAPGSFLQRLAQYRGIVRRLEPDLLLTYNWGAIEFALANLTGPVRRLHLEDGFGPEEAERQFRRRIWLRRLALRGSDVIVPSATLREIAEQVWRLDPGKVHHIPNGVPAKAQADIPLAALGARLDPRLPRIVWAGALRPEKNPLRLLRAFAPLRDRAMLLIVGDGPERETVAAAVRDLGLSDRVRLLGRRTEVRDVIMQCDVLALSSDTEQMPLVVLEAMDAGLPVASVDVGDVRCMLTPENRPFVVPRSDEALSQALAALVADPDLRRRVGEANRRRAADAYRLEDMVAAHAALLEQLAAETSRLRRKPAA